jgi:hypothetical protein
LKLCCKGEAEGGGGVRGSVSEVSDWCTQVESDREALQARTQELVTQREELQDTVRNKEPQARYESILCCVVMLVPKGGMFLHPLRRNSLSCLTE